MSAGYYELETGKVAAIEDDCDFPPLSESLIEPNGLIAIGGDLSAQRLLKAYQQGIFPWFSDGEPILWWSPDPRMVLLTAELKISRSLKKTLNRNDFECRFNTSFEQVMHACSQVPRPDQGGTWITDEMIEAYCTLHKQGYAICMETWQNNELVGGCYGIKIGQMFYGESMFHTVSDASKVAFVHMVQKLADEHVEMIDCQMHTPLLASFGAKEIARSKFMTHLTAAIQR